MTASPPEGQLQSTGCEENLAAAVKNDIMRAICVRALTERGLWRTVVCTTQDGERSQREVSGAPWCARCRTVSAHRERSLAHRCVHDAGRRALTERGLWRTVVCTMQDSERSQREVSGAPLCARRRTASAHRERSLAHRCVHDAGQRALTERGLWGGSSIALIQSFSQTIL